MTIDSATTALGPKGLRLPQWTPEIAALAKKVEEEHACAALEAALEKHRRLQNKDQPIGTDLHWYEGWGGEGDTIELVCCDVSLRMARCKSKCVGGRVLFLM